MKIAVLIPEFPSQTHSFFWREIRQLKSRHGIDVAIISTRPPQLPVAHEWVAESRVTYLYPIGLARSLALAARCTPALPRVLHEHDLHEFLLRPRNWGFFVIARQLAEICRKEGVSHLHVHSCANTAMLAALCNRMYGLPYSVVLHGPLSDYGHFQSFKWKHAAFGFVITETLRQEVMRELSGIEHKVRIAPMGVDTDVFVPLPATRKDRDGSFRWFCCGRLNPAKGYDTLLQAAEILRNREPGLTFKIEIAGEDEKAGTGYRRNVERMIAERNLGEVVLLRGAISQRDVLSALQLSDGFVLASRHEPLGVAYMEAMSCGLPTIGTRAGGVEELIDDMQDGRLVPPGQPEALAAAMRDIMANPEWRESLGRAARQKIIDKFSAHRSADMLAEMLQSRSMA